MIGHHQEIVNGEKVWVKDALDMGQVTHYARIGATFFEFWLVPLTRKWRAFNADRQLEVNPAWDFASVDKAIEHIKLNRLYVS